jgi:hypothetical protein
MLNLPPRDLFAKRTQDEKPDANDRAVLGSKFEGVATLARHSLSQAVRRILADTDGLAEFTAHDLRRTGRQLRRPHVYRSISSRPC